MECIFIFVNWREREHSAGVGGEEGQGLSCASCWLQEEIDPGEALTPVVFFFLPLRPIQTGQIPSVASKATPRAAAAPAPMAAQLGPGLDVKMDASGPCSASPRDYASSSLLPTSAFLPSLSLVLPLLPSLFIQLASKRKPFFKRGGWSPWLFTSLLLPFSKLRPCQRFRGPQFPQIDRYMYFFFPYMR